MECSVAESLRRTPKGRLVYDHQGTSDISVIVEEVTRQLNSLCIPPTISKKLVHLNMSGCPDTESSTSKGQHGKSKKKSHEKQKEKVKKTSFCDYDIEAQSSFNLKQYEDERKIKVQLSIELHKRRMDDFSKQAMLNAQNKLMERGNLLQTQQESLKWIAQMEASECDLEHLEQNQKILEVKFNKWYNEKLKEAEVIHQVEQLTAMKKREEMIKSQTRMDELLQCQKTIIAIYSEISNLLSHCQNELPPEVREALAKQKTVGEAISKLVKDASIRPITDDDVNIAKQQVKRVEAYKEAVRQGIELNRLRKVQAETTQRESVPSTNQASQSSAIVDSSGNYLRPGMDLTMDLNNAQIQAQRQPISISETARADSEIFQFVRPKALEQYIRLQDYLSEHGKSYETFMQDPNQKKYKFSLQKAVNTPVNAISPLSGTHVRDKMDRLKRLLLGQNVEVGDKRVSTKDHPKALAMCKDVLAKKLVKQGEEQIAAKHEAAFAVAATIIGLWGEFPDFGQLLLAHFHQKCPGTVPYYIPRQEGQTDEEHYRALGYAYIDGVIEKQDKYLKRMSGMMRLYAAIVSSPVPRHVRCSHPHGLGHGWTWLTRILNLDPVPDLTATVLFDFLETAGYALQQQYGNQFIKLLSVLLTDFFPKIRKVTPAGSGGPVTRLEAFLQKCLQYGRVPPPEGALPSNFWYT